MSARSNTHVVHWVVCQFGGEKLYGGTRLGYARFEHSFIIGARRKSRADLGERFVCFRPMKKDFGDEESTNRVEDEKGEWRAIWREKEVREFFQV